MIWPEIYRDGTCFYHCLKALKSPELLQHIQYTPGTMQNLSTSQLYHLYESMMRQWWLANPTMKPDKKSSGLGGLFIVQLYRDMEKISICGIDLIADIEDGLNLE